MENAHSLLYRLTGLRFPGCVFRRMRDSYRTAAPRLRPPQSAVALTSLPLLTVPLTPTRCAPTERDKRGWTRARGQADSSTASSGPSHAPCWRYPVVAPLPATPLIHA